MEQMGWVAIIGAAAWVPQIITWLYRVLTKPTLSLYLDKIPQVGYNFLGPIFNVSFALLSGRKDIVLNKFSVKLEHESGASYVFDWVGLSEDLSEIQNPIGTTMKIKKTYLPLVVKVLHAGVAQVFVRFQHTQFKTNSKKPFANAIDKFSLLNSSGKLDTEEKIEAIISESEFDTVIKLFRSEFIWAAGKYTVTFEFGSPNKFKYKKDKYTFNLHQSDIDALRVNIDNIRDYLIQSAKTDIMPDCKRTEISWNWRNPELIED